MARSSTTIEQHNDVLESADSTKELQQIDRLIRQCQSRMEGVSDGILSTATRQATLEMYHDLRREAETNVDVRAERLAWMEENVVRLQETIVKAAHEREIFEADLATAVENKWMRPDSAKEWMKKFEDSSLLEMSRSIWMKEEWGGFKKRWASLARDRDAVRTRFAQSGLSLEDVPEMKVLRDDALFLAEDRTYHTRRSLVDTADAAISAAGRKQQLFLRETESFLLAASRGEGRYLHPSKVGAWLKKIVAHDTPRAYRDGTVRHHMEGWLAARERYDALKADFEWNDRPDGCAPMPLDAFLALPYEARLTTLTESEYRLAAAIRRQEGRERETDRDLGAIRDLIDLKDLDTAEQRLGVLLMRDPKNEDVQSIAAHLGVLLEERAKNEDKREEEERTRDAHRELHQLPDGVPTPLKKKYKDLIENGDPDEAALFFLPMKVRADRVMSGQTSDEEERTMTEAAEEAESVALQTTDHEEDASTVLVKEETPLSEVIDLLKTHDKGARRSPALAFEGVPHEQHIQLVGLNERALANMRHLKKVGQKYRAPETAEEARTPYAMTA